MRHHRPWLVAAVSALALLYTTPGRAGWRQSEFVLGGLYTGDAFQPGRFVLFQQAGLNLVVNGDRNDRVDAERTAFVLDSLRIARPGFDLRLIVTYRKGADSSRIAFNPDAHRHRASLARTVGASGGILRPSVAGWWVWDEPMTDRDLESAFDLIALLDSLPETRDQLAFLSLLPVLVSGHPTYDGLHGRDRREAYRRYLGRVLAMYERRRVPAPLLCADHYPFEAGDTRSDYFLNLALLRDAAATRRAGGGPIPFWMVVQLSPRQIEGDRYHATPTVPQIRWQVSTAVAYGAKGILYWTLVPSGPGQYGPGLLDRAGAPAPRYGAVRDFNLAIRRIGPILMRLDPVGVRHQDAALDGRERVGGDAPPPIVRRVRGSGGGGLAGCLRDRETGEDYVFVVNLGLERAADIQVELEEDCEGVARITAAGAPPTSVAGAGRRFDARKLDPGTGALFRIERAVSLPR